MNQKKHTILDSRFIRAYKLPVQELDEEDLETNSDADSEEESEEDSNAGLKLRKDSV